jgi:biopolymer transport protein ExbB
MNMLRFRKIIGSVTVLVAVTLAASALAQQQKVVDPVPPPSASSPSQPDAAPQPTAAAQPASTAQPAAATGAGISMPADAGGKPLKQASTGGMHELSPWSMFLSADILVKAVMIGLAFASLMTWTIAVSKSVELWLGRRRLRGALDRIRDSKSLAEAQLALGAGVNLMGALLAVAVREVRMSADTFNDSGIKERAASSFAEITRAEARRVRFGMGGLATIGAISPFVGLFGTVWGIMNSFIGISKSQTTNLAVVAPGIAEALLATAFGLVAAIPAVIIYNHFSRVTKGYLELVGRSSGAAGRLLSRDLDRTHISSPGSTHSRAAE